ncbi:uncharacterized protein LOC117654315 [Thrips palmi]|uniref:Uncharacterized protein LOC117654315 n=1 Tax=Thrips palmi TaxID=161013 RepID=A0A6P9AMJ1_THRPL|nr:uncharacterized protein LOC117654315 [Thrips palmi]
MRRYMARCRVVFCDGTFDSRPNAPQCAQVLQIVGVVGNSAIPLAQIPMTGKTQAEYVAALTRLRQLVPRFRPNLVVTDFELGLQNAWRQVFNTHVSGCYWHFCRAVSWAAKHDLGLYRLLRINRIARSIVRASLAIPLLPHNLMARGLRTLIIEAHRAGLLDDLAAFFNYWIDTWMSPAYL